jgi:hypothetical protein
MQEINYDNYYWQNDLVRLRAMTPEDWQEAYYANFDSQARRLLQCELELPPVAETARQVWKSLWALRRAPAAGCFLSRH